MSDDIFFKAQPLNNEDASIIQVNGETIPEEQSTLREEVNKNINDTSRLGRPIYRQEGIEILQHKSRVVIELQTKSLDVLQRHAPIVCSTSISCIIKSPNMLANSINEFASKIDRELIPQREKIIKSLKTLDKRRYTPNKGPIYFIIEFIKSIISSIKN